MLPKKNRLVKDKDFGAVFKQKSAWQEGFLLLKISANNFKAARFGFVVSKKVSLKATERNKIKRRLSEAVRHRLLQVKTGYDIVLVVSSSFREKDFPEIEKTTEAILKKARLINI